MIEENTANVGVVYTNLLQSIDLLILVITNQEDTPN